MPANPLIETGRLDRRITIEVMGPPTDDGLRVKEAGWQKLCDRFAWLMPLSGAEMIAAGGEAAFQTQKFRIRRPRTFMPNPSQHRIIYRGLPWDLTEVQEIGRDTLDLVATAQPDGAQAAEVVE